MLPSLFSLTNGKSFISPQNIKIIQFSQLYIFFKESLYTISTSVNPPDPSICSCLSPSHQSELIGNYWLGGMSTLYKLQPNQTSDNNTK